MYLHDGSQFCLLGMIVKWRKVAWCARVAWVKHGDVVCLEWARKCRAIISPTLASILDPITYDRVNVLSWMIEFQYIMPSALITVMAKNRSAQKCIDKMESMRHMFGVASAWDD